MGRGPPPDPNSIKLRAVDLARAGFPPHEIAPVLGSTVGSVKTLLSQARRKDPTIPRFRNDCTFADSYCFRKIAP